MNSRYGVAVAMRDGVRLAADVHLPVGVRGAVPAVVCRTPYGRQSDSALKTARALTREGIAFVAQDVRGRFDSEGTWRQYRHRDEGRDGYDTIEWVAAQPWCDGQVGTVGGSYSGWVQWAAARQRPPHLRTMIVSAAPGLWVTEAPYCHGAFVAAGIEWFLSVAGRVVQEVETVDWERVLSHLPLGEMDSVLGRALPEWHSWLERPTLDEHWQHETIGDDELAQVDIPVLHVTGWFDEHRFSTVEYHDRLVAAAGADAPPHALLVGPWTHVGTRHTHRTLDGVDYGPQAAPDMDDIYVRWFERTLRGDSPPAQAPLRLFVTGDDDWHDLPGWPQTAGERWSLSSGGDARSADGDGTLRPGTEAAAGADRLRADPLDPVRSAPAGSDLGDTGWSTLLDHVVARPDVLVYASEPLAGPLTVVGRPTLTLHVSADVPDFDVVALLADATPGGHSRMLTHTIRRMRMRDGLSAESPPVKPGRVYALELDLGPVAHAFRTGHVLRLCVAAHYFPYYDRNLHTGEPIAGATAMRIAEITLHHGPEHPTALTLPVVPEL